MVLFPEDYLKSRLRVQEAPGPVMADEAEAQEASRRYIADQYLGYDLLHANPRLRTEVAVGELA
jgi:hypothetical protein